VLVPIAIVVFGLTMEARFIAYIPEAYLLNEDEICSPKAVDPSSIEYHSGHRFYSALKDMERLPPLTFRGEYTQLCHEELRTKLKYGYCLPISGRKDTPFCTAGDRADLLYVRSPKAVCFSSVLHKLMVDVYKEMKAKGNTPLLTFGSLLGAVRDRSMIPFTEDADIAFVEILKSRNVLMEALLTKGYHMFFYKIWRVCVAPTHPLAARLYDPSLPLTKNFAVPYVDLYRMKKRNDSLWDAQEFVGSNGRFLDENKVEPFSQVTINGMPFDTVHDPDFFLTETYGPDYMTPKPRRQPATTKYSEKG